MINGSPAHYDSPQIQVGGDETYEPRCDEHFVLPGRPLTGFDETQLQLTHFPDATSFRRP
jgi:hypothetical protein